MSQNTLRSARYTGLVAALVVCLLLMQAHAMLHASSNMDCKVCTSNLWMAPEQAPEVASLAPAQCAHGSPQRGYLPEHEFRQTSPRAPPAA